MACAEREGLPYAHGWVAARITLAAAAYAFSHHLAFLFPDAQEVLMVIWPPGGVGLASLLLLPRRLWHVILPSLFVAGGLAEIIEGRPPVVSLGLMTVNILESLSCAWLISAVCGEGVRFTRVREVVALVFAASLVNAGTAFLGAGTAALAVDAAFWESWRTWLISHGFGILLVTPLLVTWVEVRNLPHGVRWARLAEGGAFAVLWCVMAWLAFRSHENPWHRTLQPYMLIPVLALAALRLGQRGVTLAVAALAFIVISSSTVRGGPLIWGGGSPAERLLLAEVFLGVTAITGFLIAASAGETGAATRSLQASRKLLESIVEGTPDVVYIKDLRGRYVLFNSAAARFVGKRSEEVLGHDDTFILPVDEAHKLMESDRMVMDGRKLGPYEERFTSRGGPKRVFQSMKGPVFDEAGNLSGIFGIGRDITEIKQAEEALQQSHFRYQQLVDNARDGILTVDVDGRFLFVNAGICSILGYTAEELIHLNILDTYAEHDQESGRRQLNILASGGTAQFERPIKRKDGSIVVIEANAWKTTDGHIQAIVRDITERRKTEQRVVDAMNYVSTLLNASPLGIIAYKASGQTVSVNIEAARLVGAPVDDIKKQDFRELASWRGCGLLDMADRALSTGQGQSDEVFVTSSFGRSLWMSVRLVPFVFEEEQHLLLMMADIGARKQAEERLAQYQTQLERLVEERTRELEKSREQLQRAERLASIGTLAAGIAHEINNPLGMVLLGTDAAMASLNKPETLAQLLQQQKSDVERCTRIVKGVLDFARRRSTERQPLDLNEVVRRSLTFTREYARQHRVVLEARPGAGLGPITGNPTELEQVTVNLIHNAVQACQEGGHVAIETHASGDRVRLLVRDDGCGMTPGQIEHAFDPFYTTRIEQGGTGLGLSTVHGIVTSHGGRIDISSQPGKGAVFTVELPCRAASEISDGQGTGR